MAAAVAAPVFAAAVVGPAIDADAVVAGVVIAGVVIAGGGERMNWIQQQFQRVGMRALLAMSSESCSEQEDEAAAAVVADVVVGLTLRD